MRRRALRSFLVVAGLVLAACGGSPASPTPTTGSVLDATAEATANTLVTQALSQTAASTAALGSSTPLSPVYSIPCPDGGSIVTTVSTPTLTGDGALQGPVTITSRTEYNDCRSRNVLMRGAPALVHSSEISPFGPITGAPAVLTVTMRTTGGLSIVSNGVESLMRVECTSVMVAQLGQSGSTPVPQITWTGAMIWESPVGVVVRSTGCGPARP